MTRSADRVLYVITALIAVGVLSAGLAALLAFRTPPFATITEAPDPVIVVIEPPRPELAAAVCPPSAPPAPVVRRSQRPNVDAEYWRHLARAGVVATTRHTPRDEP